MDWTEIENIGKIVGTVVGAIIVPVITTILGAKKRSKDEKTNQEINNQQPVLRAQTSSETESRKRLAIAMDNLREQIRELGSRVAELSSAVRELIDVSKRHIHEVGIHGQKMDDLSESNRSINSAVHNASDKIRDFTRAMEEALPILRNIPSEISTVVQLFRSQLEKITNK